jgi:hypothetical protein
MQCPEKGCNQRDVAIEVDGSHKKRVTLDQISQCSAERRDVARGM